MSFTAGKRRALVGPPGRGFSPDYLEVDRGTPGRGLTPDRIQRGWGGVHQGSYISFLSWLDMTAETPAGGQVPRGCFNLKYEVWVHPYNWTDDNANSARRLGDTVAAAANSMRRFERLGYRTLKPILVTHSMGGLVARAYTQLHGGGGDVHGVIHGAMPTDGSPATYKRMRAGFEGVESQVLGRNQSESTATAGNLPGPLELLPNGRHRSVNGTTNWLRGTGQGGGRLWARPAANPYGEIYVNQADWWRLIYRQYLDPDGDPDGRSAFRQSRTQIIAAASYHSRLGSSGYHPNTRMFYAADRGHPCWDHIEWRQTSRVDTPSNAQPQRNDENGTVEWGRWSDPVYTPYGANPPVFIADTRYEIQEPDAPGDGTVHAGSGKYVSGPMSVPTRNGFVHQSAFDLGEARRFVSEWLFAMVQEQL
ncbi:esterase/lipase family protein [Jannaschia marina]|uniref:esterase/lipase family protein n=1 Tax=Jannaschia marina TaxID=2741674 RepID=UPI0015CAC1F5|nr:hypothetical protein [Jannaschia marina]